MIGSLSKELKELKDPLKKLQENMSNVQSDLMLLKEKVELKGLNDCPTKHSRLPKVITVC